jgi:hypothetical protein
MDLLRNFFCRIAGVLAFFGTGAALASALVLPPDAEILATLKNRLGGEQETVQREVKRTPNRTIEITNFILAEMDPKLAPAILADYRHYDWVLTDINRRPTGGTYFALLLGLSVEPQTPDPLIVKFAFDLPLFNKPHEAPFKMETHTDRGVFTLNAEAMDTSGTFTHAEVALKLFPAPRSGYSYLFVKGEAQLRSWVLYEALPEKLLNRESGERVRIILDNYLREETARRAPVK